MIVQKHLVRDLMYLYTSIISAGMRNIVSQMFFDSYYPENKETLVSLSLFFNALFTMFGIMASTRMLRSTEWTKGRKKSIVTVGMSFLFCMSFASMFMVKNFAAYTAMFCITGFALNFLYNVFDVFISGDTAPEEKEKNVRILLTYQMAGYIIGPLFFSLFEGSSLMCMCIAVGLLLICYLPVSSSYISSSVAVRKTAEASAVRHSSLSLKDKDNIVMLYSFMMSCATNVLMTSVAYTMKDYLLVENYALTSSLFLAGTVLVSAAVIALIPAMKLWKLQWAAPLSIALALALIMILKSSSPILLTIAAVLSGAGNSIFLSGSRYYVNSAEPERGLVQRYNRTMTEATLIGFMVTAAISWLCERNGFTVVPAKLTAIIIMLAAALIFGCFPTERKKTA
ncbi:MAG: hypothetical protein IKH75_13340 [Ruminococcus sp.]|nr:hypothetical protein [Ruminococcus sp.]